MMREMQHGEFLATVRLRLVPRDPLPLEVQIRTSLEAFDHALHPHRITEPNGHKYVTLRLEAVLHIGADSWVNLTGGGDCHP